MESLRKHKKKHEAEHKMGEAVHQGNTYRFNCTTFKVSFKSHDDMMDHLSNVHLTESQRKGEGLSKNYPVNGVSKHEDRPPTCYNADQCRFHREHRCNFYHPLPPKERQARRPRQAPSSQWKSVSSRHSSGGAGQRQQGHQVWKSPRNTSLTWCKHEDNCLQGRVCVLREEGEQGFSWQSQQDWN